MKAVSRHVIDGYSFLKKEEKEGRIRYSSDLTQELPCGGHPMFLNTLIGYLEPENGTSVAREKILRGEEYHSGYIGVFPHRDQNDPDVIQFKQKFEESRGFKPEGPIWLIGHGPQPNERMLLPEGTKKRILEWYDSVLEKA